MIEETLKKMETQIEDASAISDDCKQEFRELLSVLKDEVANLSAEEQEQAGSVANFVESLAHESTRRIPNPALKEISSQGLETSLKEFEVTHPNITAVVNSISNLLSGIGI